VSRLLDHRAASSPDEYRAVAKVMTSSATEQRTDESGAQRAEAQFAAGNACMQAGRFAEAAAAYRRALALNRAGHPRTTISL
jgi:tetratricopeptide (TPR) repeat protein